MKKLSKRDKKIIAKKMIHGTMDERKKVMHAVKGYYFGKEKQKQKEEVEECYYA